MQPKNIQIADYTYDLPEASIAHHPLPDRDASRLLLYREGDITETTYRHIAGAIPDDSLLVFNNTKVVEARIIFTKPSGGKIEIFCLEPPPGYGGVGPAMTQTGRVQWKCLIGGASKWKPGQVLTRTIQLNRPESILTDQTAPTTAVSPQATHPAPFTPSSVPSSIPSSAPSSVPSLAPASAPSFAPATTTSSALASATSLAPASATMLVLEARYLDKIDGAFLIEFSWTPAELSFAELLHLAGLIPLPPYIRRTPEAADSERYQTVYARHDGSVAAPTAGLHFTQSIFDSLAEKGIDKTYVTLHVGAGTFLPVKSATMEGHNMHVEYIEVDRTTIETLIHHLRSETLTPSAAGNAARGLIIPVGTTSARTLESLYWLGVKTLTDPDISQEAVTIHQWDAYELPGNHSATEALTALLAWMDKKVLTQLMTRTQLLITPGYRWRIAGALVTNFHQPESTLLLLVASLIGEDWRKVYEYAQNNGFRFLSYGDGSLLFPSSF